VLGMIDMLKLALGWKNLSCQTIGVAPSGVDWTVRR